MSGLRDSSSSMMSVIELPDIIQSLGQQRRSGMLVVHLERGQRRIYFRDGSVCAFVNARPGNLYHGLIWCHLASPRSFVEWGLPKASTMGDHLLYQQLTEGGHVPLDGLRDAIDCLIEEGFVEILGIKKVTYDFEVAHDEDPWALDQIALGTALGASGLLMEGMRRKDELRRLSRQMPKIWDILVREPVFDDALPAHAAAFLRAWRDDRPCGAVAELSALTPSQAHLACSELLARGVLRVADGNELLVFADRARSKGQYRMAEGLYRRSIELGAAAGRVHLAMGELAERRGDELRAAGDYLRAARDLEVTSPVDAVMALRNSLRLGGDTEQCLRLLLDIYRRLEEEEETREVLFQLAQYYEEHDQLSKAMEAVREAQQVGADPIRSAQVLAGLALLLEDEEEAPVHLEVVVRNASEAGMSKEADQARHQILLIDPGRSEMALAYARNQLEGGDRNEAAATIRRCLDAPDHLGGEELEVALRELLASIDPEDKGNHDWLAQVYQSRKDRAGASKQLVLLAEMQEREGNLDGLASTLGRMLELGGDQIDTICRLAVVEERRGMTSRAMSLWEQGVKAAQDFGDLERAREISHQALHIFPEDPVLHARYGRIAARAGEVREAADHLRRGIALLRGAARLGEARTLLLQLLNLRPDDLVARMDLADVAVATDSDDKDELLAEFIHYAVRTENIGLALSRAWIRSRVAPSYESRSELVELLRRVGRAQEELKVGQSLIDDLVAEGSQEQAVEVVQRLVSSHPDNPALVKQLAELHEDLGKEHAAIRFYRHAVVLLQQADDYDGALHILGHLAKLTDHNPEVERARQLLEDGHAINWSAIRDERAIASKQRLAEGQVAEDSSQGRRRVKIEVSNKDEAPDDPQSTPM